MLWKFYHQSLSFLNLYKNRGKIYYKKILLVSANLFKLGELSKIKIIF